MPSRRKNVKLDESVYDQLKELAKQEGLNLGDALAEAVRQYCNRNLGGGTVGSGEMQEQIDDLRQQLDQVRQAIQPSQKQSNTAPIGTYDKPRGRHRGQAVKRSKTMQTVEPQIRSRRREPNERLAFLVLLFDSKPRRGATREELRDQALDIWRASLDYGCISWGLTPGHLLDSLSRAERIDLRQRSDFLDLRGGDVVIATWGKQALGWGVVQPNPKDETASSYEFRDPDLAELWDNEDLWFSKGHWIPHGSSQPNEEIGWFQHTVRVDWKQTWELGEVEFPSIIAPQPTLRRPHVDNQEAWQVIRDLGIPVDSHGTVVA